MKKNIKIILIILFTFFIFNIGAKALAPLCSYTGHEDESDPNNWVYVYVNGSKTLMYTPDTKPMESLTDEISNFLSSLPDNAIVNGVTGLTDFLGLTNVAQSKGVSLNNGTTLYFNGSYSYLYISLFLTGHRDKTFPFIFWGYENDDQSVPNQMKIDFVQGGKCPDYVCLCKADNNKTSGFGYKTHKAEEPFIDWCESQGCTVSDLKFDLLNDNRIFRLSHYTSIIDKASTDQISILSYDEISDLIDLYYLKITCNTDDSKCMNDADIHRIAVMLVNQDQRIEASYKNVLKNKDLKFADSSTQAKYKELVTAAEYFKRAYSTGAGSLIDLYEANLSCKNIIGDVNQKGSFAYYLQRLFTFVQYIGPILVIVLTSVEYFKSIFDDASLKNANKRTIKRLILLVVLFFIPMLLKFILSVLGVTSNCGIK